MNEHLLTQSERTQFEDTHGYLVVPDALSETDIERTVRAVDRHASAFADPNFPNVNAADILSLDEAFVDLVDRPAVLPRICGLLGWNIWVNHSHFNVNPPAATHEQRTETVSYGWHRDGGSIRRDLANPLPPLMMIKVAFYLTDVDEDSGPTWIIEGSHRGGAEPKPHILPTNARPMTVRRGTAIIFGNRVVHSFQSPNRSTVVRKAVFLSYAYRWLQPIDRSSTHGAMAIDSPVRRQLLGLTTTYEAINVPNKGRSGNYYPKDEDVPLRKHILTLRGSTSGG